MTNQFSGYAKDLIKSNIPFNLRRRIRSFRERILGKKNKYQANKKKFSFDPNTSAAFCVPRGDWARGIYINDEARFNGIVASNNIIDLSHEISDKINNDKIAKQHGISSHVKPRFNTHVSQYYPDIVLDVPDGYIIKNNAKGFVTEFKGIKSKNNTNCDTLEMWAKNTAKKRWVSLCVRGYHPIAVSSRQWTEKILLPSNDLTAIYRHLLNQF